MNFFKKILKKSFFFNFFIFKLFLFFPTLIKLTRPIKKKSIKYAVKKNFFIFDNVGKIHPNETYQGFLISFYQIILEINEILNKNYFKKIDILNFKSDLKVKNIYFEFLNELKSLNKIYPDLSFAIFLIFIGNFKLLLKLQSRIKNNNHNKIVKEFIDIYLFKYIDNFSDSNDYIKIKNKLLNFIIKQKDYLKLLLCKYSIEQKISDFKIFNVAKRKLKSLNNYHYIKKYKNNILGSNIYAFGHLINLIDQLHRQKKLLNIQPKKIIISPYFVANSCLANYLKLKYTNCIIDHKQFLYGISQKKILNNDPLNFEQIDFKNSLYQLPYNEFKKFKKISPSVDSKIFNSLINLSKKNKIKIRKKYVLLILRDSSFKSYDEQLNSNDDRYSGPTYLKNLIKLVNDKGYQVILGNGNLRQDLSEKIYDYFDYSNSKLRDDFNDINLVKNCSFIIRLGTSSSLLSLLFNKYILNINYPLNRKPVFHNLSYYLPKKIIKYNKEVNFEEYYNNDLMINHDYNILKNKNYKLVDNDWHKVKTSFEVFFQEFKNNTCKLFNKKKYKDFYYPINLL
jgi:putative glycosyltransferase (TIGR04372 family)